MQDLIGQDLGRYHIIERLGEGGMATVYKAFDTRLEREVAVKLIRKEAFGQEVLDRMLQRFEREAKALSKLTHANIVPIIDFGDEGGAPYLVMPMIDGGTLKQRLERGSFSVAEAVHILEPIARALDYAHAKGILHRDVKPSNILITDSGDPMLSDFGVAKILEEGESATLTGTGIGLGTPEYMAPEQWVGKAIPASDQYSLGVVFYEMITGHKPYTADTPAAVLLKQANEPLPRPRLYVEELPDEVEHVLFKALSKKPEDRFPSMAEFGAALGRIDKMGLSNVKAKKGVKTSVQESHATFDQLESAPSSKRSGQNITVSISTKALVGLLVGIAVIALGIIGITSGWFTPEPVLTATTAPIVQPVTESTTAPTAARADDPSIKVCLVTDIGGIGDKAYNDISWQGVKMAAEDYDIEAEIKQSIQVSDYAVNLAQCKDAGFTVIICTGLGMADDCAKAASQNPDVYYVGVDFAEVDLPNLRGDYANMDDSSYLAGYLAAGMSSTGTVGWYTGLMFDAVQKWGEGYYYGVQKYNEVHGTAVRVIGYDPENPMAATITDNWIDPNVGRSTGQAMIDEGADIILPVNGGVGVGTAALMQEFGQGMIFGVDVDWTKTHPEYSDQILASLTKNVDVHVYDAIKRVANGTWEGGDFILTLANGGTELVYNPSQQIPDWLKQEMDNLAQAIKMNMIVLPDPKPIN